jgi:glucosamine--fructose-6-phosphate aminotransferase (isomerizing)
VGAGLSPLERGANEGESPVSRPASSIQNHVPSSSRVVRDRSPKVEGKSLPKLNTGFLAQITAAYLLGLYLAQLRGNIFSGQIKDVLADLGKIPAKIQKILDTSGELRELARSMKDEKSVLFLGRHVGFPVALEGALKLKEIAYIHAEGFAAGELKHGPIALIDDGQPVFVVVPSPRGRDSLHSKVVSNIQEVRARGARTLVIAEEGDESVKDYAEHVFYVPETPTLLMPLLTTVPLQIFAAELAGAKGYDVDQPRNLAKSVTVE